MRESEIKTPSDTRSDISQVSDLVARRKIQRLDTAVLQQCIDSEEDLLSGVSQYIDDALSVSDNAASLLHLMMSDTSIKGSWRGVLVYAMKALKSMDDDNCLPAALLEEASARQTSKFLRCPPSLPSPRVTNPILAPIRLSHFASLTGSVSVLGSAQGLGTLGHHG